MILSHRAPSSLNMSSYRAIWTHFRPNFIFFGKQISDPPKIQTFPKMQISSSSHSHKYLTYMGRWISKSQYGRNQFEISSRKLLACYQPGRSKTLSGGVVMGFTFSLKMVGTKILVPGSWYQDLGTKILVPTIFREKVKPITTSPDKVFKLSG